MNELLFIRLVYEIALKVRLLREHEKSRTAGEEELSERELLALEAIKAFAKPDVPLKEIQLGRVLGLQPSSLNELVKRLVDRGYIEKTTQQVDKRQRFLSLTKKGTDFFNGIKQRSAQRYLFLLRGIGELPHANALKDLLQQMNANASRQILERCFDQVPPEDSEINERELARLLEPHPATTRL